MSKASKLRHCPALGRDISPADCGEQRQSRLACPEGCAHNPFAPANYSQTLEIEERLDGKTMKKLADATLDDDTLRTDIARANRRGLHALHAFFTWKLFFDQEADQTSNSLALFISVTRNY